MHLLIIYGTFFHPELGFQRELLIHIFQKYRYVHFTSWRHICPSCCGLFHYREGLPEAGSTDSRSHYRRSNLLCLVQIPLFRHLCGRSFRRSPGLELEKYLRPQGDSEVVAELTTEAWVLEIYGAIIGTMSAVAWMLLVFFVFTLIAFVIVRGREMKQDS